MRFPKGPDWLLRMVHLGETVSSIYAEVSNVRNMLHELLREQRAVKQQLDRVPRYATVALFWNYDEEQPLDSWGFPSRTGFASVTMEMPQGQTQGEMLPATHVPANSWLVAFGCHLTTVLVGTDLVDANMPRRAPMVRIGRAIPRGVLLRFTLVPLERQ